jgi:hypothetical protein
MARVMESRTRIGLAGVVAVAGGLTLPMLATRTFAAAPSPPFTQCPALGVDTSCGTLIVINADGSLTIVSDLSQRPIDGGDDTLLGVVNNSAAAVPNLRLSSTTLKIFGFEGDGICAYRFTGNGYCATRPRGSTGYEGPDIVFSNISGDQKSGTLNFTEPDGGLPAGAATYFSLENAVQASNIVVVPAPTVLSFTNTSAATSDFKDPAVVAAALTAGGAPVSGASVTFTIASGTGAATCNGISNLLGVASCSITPNERAGGYQISASFAGNSVQVAASATEAFAVTLEQDTVSYVGPLSVTIGQPAALFGLLTTDDPAARTPLGGRSVTLTIGSGVTTQSCVGTTDSSGLVSCSIPSVSQVPGTAPASASFAGDSYYVSATAVGAVTASRPVVSTPVVGAGSPLRGVALIAAGGALVAAGGRRRRGKPSR